MSESFWEAEPPPPEDPIRTDIINMIHARNWATPRHRQVALGPSNVSHPCQRKIAYSMMQAEGTNPPFDPLPSIIGTAMHTWMESAAQHANEILGRERWLTETRVEVAPGLTGSCDLYDKDTGTVIDHKVVGTTRLRKYRKDPGPAYKAQVFLYGRGFENAGLPVNQVAISFIPRGATLHSLHVWKSDYSRATADWVLNRWNTTIALLDDFDVENNPDRYQWIPATPQGDCVFCPWYSTNPQGPLQCKGDGS